MKNKTPLVLITLAACALLSMAATRAEAQDKAPSKDLLAKAKISHAEAEKIALAAVPNATIKESELEEEDGGLRWSFDLKTPGSKKITEIGVDAVTGKVVENKAENEKDEVKENAGREKKG